MVYRYCKTENFSSASVCIACGKPLLEESRQPLRRDARYAYRRYADLSPARHDARYAFRIQPGTRLSARHFPTEATAPLANSGLSVEPAPPLAFASTQRMEPRLDSDAAPVEPESAVPPYAYSEAEAFGRASTSAGDARPLLATTFSRVTFVASCFALAIGAGLFGAWWMNDPAIARALAAMSKRGQAPGSLPVESSPTPHARQSFGISSGELPYDGVPPDPPLAAPTPADAAIKPRALPEESLKPDVNGSAESAAPVERPVAPSGQAQEEAATTSEDVPNDPAPAPKATPRDKLIKPVRPLQRQGATPKLARHKEIDRLRQQVEDELKKRLNEGES